MGKKENKVWVSLEQLNNDPKFIEAQASEFPELPNANEFETTGEETASFKSNRRDFLKYAGFGIGAAALASCEIPVKKAIPYVVKPEEIVPGVANYYASAFINGGDFVPTLVKTREGRPIKIEGNPDSPMTGGGTSARSQASVLSLYDTNRIKSPGKVNNDTVEAMSWADLDKTIMSKLSATSKIAIVSSSLYSPSTEAAIKEFQVKYPNTEVVMYDPVSYSAILEANQATKNKAVFPDLHFDQADYILSIEADFLGTWASPTEYSKGYVERRKLNEKKLDNSAAKTMSRHVQFESRMSLTGSNADNRVLIAPSEHGAALVMLYNEVARGLGQSTIQGPSGTFKWAKAEQAIKAAAKELIEVANNSKKNALVVCGINDVNLQIVVNGLNEMLGAYGTTITFEHYAKNRRGSDKAIQNLTANLGNYDAVFIHQANPAYDLPGLASEFAKGLEQVALTVSFNPSIDETTALCKYVAPASHTLESWGDAEPKNGNYYLLQPTISPIFKTRTALESFLTWGSSAFIANKYEQPSLEYIKKYWRENIFPQANALSFDNFWQESLRTGFYILSTVKAPVTSVVENVVDGDSAEVVNAPVVSGNISSAAAKLTPPSGSAIEVSFYETVNMGAGQYANNPWLQEMPDPVMRTTWDNFISVPIHWNAEGLGNEYVAFNNLEDGDIVDVTIDGSTYALRVVRQFGQLDGTVAISLGYGRRKAGTVGTGVGTDLFPAVKVSNGMFQYFATEVQVSEKVGADSDFAGVQMHHTYGLKNTYEGEEINVDERVLGHVGFQGSLTNRSVFFESNASELKESIDELVEKRSQYQYLNDKGLYPGHEETYEMGHHWGMSVDLSACTGCGACTVACMAENNVPVVGKHEVSIAHDMSWLRIDRYYYGEEETPNTAYMPMMCQHCDNAPCENVCPVAATNHSSEGLNQMTYNRCIGTRYCANNCPYKVRRFNWLDYTSADTFPWNEADLNRGTGKDEHTYMTDNLTRMVLNPDVTVRSRGVIEKCSFCVQRIQEGKLKAKVEGRRLGGDEIQPACQQACPTGGLIFGDQNDKNSKLVERWSSPRTYFALEEVNVRPSVGYMMKVINRKEEFTA